MRVALLLLLTGCDLFFLQENKLIPDAAPDAPLRCPDAFMGQRYVLVQTDMTWFDAEKTCREQMGGTDQSHLAVITSQAEYQTIRALIGSSDYFVGITNRRGLFQWITREAPQEEVWADGQPDGSAQEPYCGVAFNDGMHDAPCSVVNDFICECDGFVVDLERF